MPRTSLLPLLVALFLLGTAAPASAESCCQRAKAAGALCDHLCCVKARKEKKVCEKCNAKADKEDKEDKKDEEKQKDKNKEKDDSQGAITRNMQNAHAA